jgi:hypothetical protein
MITPYASWQRTLRLLRIKVGGSERKELASTLNGSNGRHYARVPVAGSQHEENMWPFVLSQAEGHSKGGLSAQIR